MQSLIKCTYSDALEIKTLVKFILAHEGLLKARCISNKPIFYSMVPERHSNQVRCTQKT